MRPQDRNGWLISYSSSVDPNLQIWRNYRLTSFEANDTYARRSWVRILDGHFSYLFVVNIVLFVWKDENKWKTWRGWPILKKKRYFNLKLHYRHFQLISLIPNLCVKIYWRIDSSATSGTTVRYYGCKVKNWSCSNLIKYTFTTVAVL